MAVDVQYGKVSLKGVPADEPVRVLRAADLAAPRTLAAYRETSEAVGCGPGYLAAVADDEQRFRDFQSGVGEEGTKPADQLAG